MTEIEKKAEEASYEKFKMVSAITFVSIIAIGVVLWEYLDRRER